MSTEYVKLTPPELIYGETNLLQSQLGLVMILKQYQEYEVLRKEELFMKLELKKKLGEAKEFLDQLSKSLPESKFLEEQEKKEKMQRELVEKVEGAVQRANKTEWKHWKEKESKVKEEKTEVKEEAKSSIDKELEEIREKLKKLQ